MSGKEDAAGPAAARHRAELEAYWKGALRQAEVLARSVQRGTLPAGWAWEAERIEQAQLDWRSHLSVYRPHSQRLQRLRPPLSVAGALSRRPARRNGGGAHRRGHQRLGGRCADRAVLGEVRGIFAAYPHLDGQLWYADAALYGPYPLGADAPLPQPEGGGGTSFRPFFAALAQESATPAGERLAVYLTDGYGDFRPSCRTARCCGWSRPAGWRARSFRLGKWPGWSNRAICRT